MFVSPSRFGLVFLVLLPLWVCLSFLVFSFYSVLQETPFEHAYYLAASSGYYRFGMLVLYPLSLFGEAVFFFFVFCCFAFVLPVFFVLFGRSDIALFSAMLPMMVVMFVSGVGQFMVLVFLCFALLFSRAFAWLCFFVHPYLGFFAAFSWLSFSVPVLLGFLSVALLSFLMVFSGVMPFFGVGGYSLLLCVPLCVCSLFLSVSGSRFRSFALFLVLCVPVLVFFYPLHGRDGLLGMGGNIVRVCFSLLFMLPVFFFLDGVAVPRWLFYFLGVWWFLFFFPFLFVLFNGF